jgi:ankyrin repeat protein
MGSNLIMEEIEMGWLHKHSMNLFGFALLACILVCTHANAQVNDLIDAAGKGDLSRVRALLDAKADINAKMNNGVTALILASNNGHADVVRALLDAKADVNAKMNNSGTALMAASANGHADVVRVLLDAKADVNAKMKDGTTALMIASERGHTDVVRALLDAKADVNAKMDNGGTALMLASANGHADVVRTLLDVKADVNTKMDNGSTALKLASQNFHADVVQLLESAGNANQQQDKKNENTSQSATSRSGFSHEKYAPDVVSGVNDWDYPGIYYPTIDGAKSTQKVMIRVTARVTGNNDGTVHWWSFRVEKIYTASNETQSLAFEVAEENPNSAANRPVIIIEGKYRLVPKITSIYQILFEQEPEK